MKKTLNILAILTCFICIILIISCRKNERNTIPIKIGINTWTGYDPFILAEKMELFKTNNVLVEIKRYSSTTKELQAILVGKIQGACLTLDEVFSLTESGFRGKVVLVIDYSMGGDMLIGQKEIKKMSELKGKTIGYEGTVVGEFLLDRALHKYQIKPSAVKLIDVKANNWLSAFDEKKVDALVCFNPVATTLLNKKDGNLLFSSAEMPFEIIDVLIFSDSFYNENKTAITNIIKTWFDALTYIKTNSDNAAQIISSFKNISPEEYKQGLKGLILPDLKVNKIVFNSKSANNIYKYSQVIVNFMIDKGLLSKRINTTDLFSSEILSKIDDK
jgi:NitT/TauT family transport system substrate-binding protein